MKEDTILCGVIAHYVVYGETCQADSWPDFYLDKNSMSEKKILFSFFSPKWKRLLQMRMNITGIVQYKKTSEK